MGGHLVESTLLISVLLFTVSGIVLFIVYQVVHSPHFAYIRSYIKTGSALNGISSLSGYPIVGSLPALSRGPEGLYSTLNKLADIGGKDGIAYCWVGPSIVVSLYDDAMVRSLLSQSEDVVTRDNDRGLYYPLATFNRIVGPQIFAWSDKKSKEAKAPFHALFASHRALGEYFQLVLDVSKKHVERLVSEAPNRRVGLPRLIDDFSNDLWAQAAFGVRDAHLQTDGLAPLLQKIDFMTADYAHLVRHAIWSIFNRCSNADPEENKTGSALKSIVMSRIETALKQEDAGQVSMVRKFSMESGGAADGPLHEHAVGFAKLATFAGSQSNKHFITWAMYELNRHPEIVQKLHAELVNVLPASDDLWDKFDHRRFEEETPYLDAFLKEVARMYPSTDTVPRVIMKPFSMTTPTGKKVFLQPGAMVFCLLSHLHASERWGPDAAEFVPQRWLDKRIPKGAYMPTGYGPRGCPGFRLSMMGTKMYMAMLVRNHEVWLDEFVPVPVWTGYRSVPDTTFYTARKYEDAVVM